MPDPIQDRPAATTLRPGFSLIELLVVISIIAVLIGILLPVLGSVRDAGKATVCMSNMRNLGQAMGMYHVDNRSTFPQPAQEGALAVNGSTGSAAAERLQGEMLWFNALDYYLQKSAKAYSSGDAAERNFETFKQDPAWSNLPSAVPTSSGSVAINPALIRTIKMNEYFGYLTIATTPTGGPPVKFFRVTDIDLPGKTALFVDGRAHDTLSLTTGFADYNASNGASSGLFAAREVFVAPRHQEGANVAKVDGGVEFQSNPIRQTTSAGYPGWYDTDDPTPANRPDLIFNFDGR